MVVAEVVQAHKVAQQVKAEAEELQEEAVQAEGKIVDAATEVTGQDQMRVVKEV